MAAPATWSEWLAGLWNRLRGPPAPGSHEAWLEELRLGALLKQEAAKPPGQRDEERFHQLTVEHSKLMLEGLQVGGGGGGGSGGRRRGSAGPELCALSSAASSCFFDRRAHLRYCLAG